MKRIGRSRWGVVSMMPMFNSLEAIKFRSILNCFECVLIGIFWNTLL